MNLALTITIFVFSSLFLCDPIMRGFAVIVTRLMYWTILVLFIAVAAYVAIRMTGVPFLPCATAFWSAFVAACLVARCVTSPLATLMVVPLVSGQVWAITSIVGWK